LGSGTDFEYEHVLVHLLGHYGVEASNGGTDAGGGVGRRGAVSLTRINPFSTPTNAVPSGASEIAAQLLS
jgi:hypothetical protein